MRSTALMQNEKVQLLCPGRILRQWFTCTSYSQVQLVLISGALSFAQTQPRLFFICLLRLYGWLWDRPVLFVKWMLPELDSAVNWLTRTLSLLFVMRDVERGVFPFNPSSVPTPHPGPPAPSFFFHPHPPSLWSLISLSLIYPPPPYSN